MSSDIEIAQAASLKPIKSIARLYGVDKAELIPHGRHCAKIHLDALERLERERPAGKLIDVTAITPTVRSATFDFFGKISLRRSCDALGAPRPARRGGGALFRRPARQTRRIGSGRRSGPFVVRAHRVVAPHE